MIYYTSKTFCACVGACAYNGTPLLKGPKFYGLFIGVLFVEQVKLPLHFCLAVTKCSFPPCNWAQLPDFKRTKVFPQEGNLPPPSVYLLGLSLVFFVNYKNLKNREWRKHSLGSHSNNWICQCVFWGRYFECNYLNQSFEKKNCSAWFPLRFNMRQLQALIKLSCFTILARQSVSISKYSHVLKKQKIPILCQYL